MNEFAVHYQSSFIEKGFERAGIIATICERYPIKRCLYPGSHIHVTPSFHIAYCVYVDNDRTIAERFADPGALMAFVRDNKKYPDEPDVRFYGRGYHSPLPERKGSFDLLISQYAGFVSEFYADYLRPGGVLWVNNSHGDASRASLDPAYEPAGVFLHGGSFADSNVESYFVPQAPELHTIANIKRTKQGTTFMRPAASYLFIKK